MTTPREDLDARTAGPPHGAGSGRDGVRRRSRPELALVVEQILGHVTYGNNLSALLAANPRANVSLLEVTMRTDGLTAHIPGLSNWTAQSAIDAARMIRRRNRVRPIDAMLIHTQVPAVLNVRWMRRIPTVIGLDATPVQFDELGELYGHHTSPRPVERFKRWANVRCYRQAAHVVAWSEWTKQSLMRDYGVAPEKITVMSGGVQVQRWRRVEGVPSPDQPLRILFVGADLDRKGGRLLLEAARMLRAEPDVPAFELHVVTGADIEAEPGVVAHGRFEPNSPELIELYHSSHIFCLPTFADCLPMVLPEAAAAGLTLIATDVGAIREIVRPDDTGLLVPPRDLDALVAALRRALTEPELRARLSRNAAALVSSDHDAAANAERLIDVLLAVIR